MLGTGARDCYPASFEAVRFKLCGRLTVVRRGQEVAGHKDKNRFAGHCCVRCEILERR